MPMFRKKPIVIKAVQWHGNNWTEIAVFHRGDDFLTEQQEDGSRNLLIRTLEGTMSALPGDWVIEGVKGEVYPCKPDIFEATYEPAEALVA